MKSSISVSRRLQITQASPRRQAVGTFGLRMRVLRTSLANYFQKPSRAYSVEHQQFWTRTSRDRRANTEVVRVVWVKLSVVDDVPVTSGKVELMRCRYGGKYQRHMQIHHSSTCKVSCKPRSADSIQLSKQYNRVIREAERHFRAEPYPRPSSSWPSVAATLSLQALPYWKAVSLERQDSVYTWQPGYLFRASTCHTMAADNESSEIYK